jgi:hypothetical protein
MQIVEGKVGIVKANCLKTTEDDVHRFTKI